MKTRIVHTKVWEDGFFINLTPTQKLAFLYLLTNERVNICGAYELPDRVACFNLDLKKEEWEEIKTALAEKVAFKDSWVYLKNVDKYNNYRFSERNEKAFNKELTLIPEPIREYFQLEFTMELDKNHTSMIVVSKAIDTNYKQEIRNNKPEKGVVRGKHIYKDGEVSDDDCQEIAAKYNLPVEDVLSAREDMSLWSQSGGKQKLDWKLTLMGWVRRNAKTGPPEYFVKAVDGKIFKSKEELLNAINKGHYRFEKRDGETIYIPTR